MIRVAANDSCYLTPNELFEYRANLAKTDHARFKLELEEKFEKILLQVPPERHQGLRQLHWRIGMEVERAPNPVSAMLSLEKMMWNQFFAEDGFLFAMDHFKKI